MSNYITDIQLSGVTYALSAQSSGGSPTVELTQAEYDALVSAGTVASDTYYIITDAQAGDLTNYYTKTETNTLLGGKQATLVSGTNIKTINNESILGSGNIDIQGSGVNVVQTTGTSTTDVMSQNAVTSNFIYDINLNYKFNGRDTLALQGKGKNLFIPYMTINGEKVLSINDLSVVETSAVTSSVTSSSTDDEIPTAKAVYDAIPTVPTSASQLTNDIGYITSGDAQTQIDNSISGKVDTTTFNTYSGNVETSLSGKQDTLSAGTGIDITDNIISATGGGSITIDTTLDSGSTNPVANSAITEAVLVPSYRGLIEVEDDVVFPNATALYVEKNGSRDSCYIQAYLSGESSVEDFIFIESFTAHTFEQEPSYVDYQWADGALILTPKASGNYFYKASDIWGNLKLSTIDNYFSGSSSSVIQNEIYPRISEIKAELNSKTDTVTTDINFYPSYYDYGGYWRYDLRWKNSNMINYTTYINKLRYNDFGYDSGVITVKKTSGVTSGSTDCITSGGVYEQMGGMKIVKITESEYAALVTKDSDTLYVVIPDPTNP